MSFLWIWSEIWKSVHSLPPIDPDPLDDPRVRRAQRECDEIQATVRMLQAKANAQQRRD